jgi:hypothetical protein
MPLDDPLNQFLGDLLTVLTSGNRGYVAMEAAIAQGYVQDPGRMRAIYDEHEAEIEEFFQEADVEAVLADLQSSSGGGPSDGGDLTTAATSAAAGSVLTYFLTS